MHVRGEPQEIVERTVLEHLIARDFRNLDSIDTAIPRDGMVILGENGQGKTNLLEAVRYLTLMRSARGAMDADLVRHGAAGFFLSARSSEMHERVTSIGFDAAQKRKKVVVDGRQAARLSDAFGSLVTVLLSPADVQLISGGPGERRHYMDVLLSLVDPKYLGALQQYRAALLRRNAMLREAARGQQSDAAISVWEPMLAEYGVELWKRRAAWCAHAAEEFSGMCALMGEHGRAEMQLSRRGAALDFDFAGLLQSLEEHRATDIRRGSTGVGPHRDDIRITLDGRELRLFGSGGQQRTAAVALRFLETVTLRESSQRWPVLLLDDPFAELDARRAARIMGIVEERIRGQVLLAVPREDDVPQEFTRLQRMRMRDGKLESWAE